MYLSYITYWHSAVYDIVFKFIDFCRVVSMVLHKKKWKEWDQFGTEIQK